MEKLSRFDLNVAIENWRQELAAQLDLSPEVRRELETHLRDTIAELQKHGLNDEESFWLARRRVGQPRQLCEEFVKADPVKVWRERILWIAVGILGLRLWSGIVTYAWYAVSEPLRIYLLQHNPMLPDWVLFYLPFLRIRLAPLFRSPILTTLVCYAPIVCLAILFARGRLSWAVAGLRLLFKSRRRFLFVAAGGLAI
ncbi:MAG TPA: permease prefix domain 1-containing protein, partial [Verrucomicrobiae bacterium]|nr:permease prefix domain 1-containing protein [Verrucomicrobiae bacterium]